MGTSNETGQLAILAGAATAVYLLIQGNRLARFSKEFELVTNVRVHQVTLDRLILGIDITFKNPTDARLTLKHPTVKFYMADPKSGATAIAVSTVENKVYDILPNAETQIDTVFISLSYLSSSGIGALYQFLRAYLNGLTQTFYIRTLTQVNGTVPVEQNQTFTISGRTIKPKTPPVKKVGIVA